jgi:hypothetical protein
MQCFPRFLAVFKLRSGSEAAQDQVRIKSGSSQDQVRIKSGSSQDQVRIKSGSSQDRVRKQFLWVAYAPGPVIWSNERRAMSVERQVDCGGWKRVGRNKLAQFRRKAIGKRRPAPFVIEKLRNAFAFSWPVLRIRSFAASRCRQTLCVHRFSSFVWPLTSCRCCADCQKGERGSCRASRQASAEHGGIHRWYTGRTRKKPVFRSCSIRGSQFASGPFPHPSSSSLPLAPGRGQIPAMIPQLLTDVNCYRYLLIHRRRKSLPRNALGLVARVYKTRRGIPVRAPIRRRKPLWANKLGKSAGNRSNTSRLNNQR